MIVRSRRSKEHIGQAQVGYVLRYVFIPPLSCHLLLFKKKTSDNGREGERHVAQTVTALGRSTAGAREGKKSPAREHSVVCGFHLQRSVLLSSLF